MAIDEHNICIPSLGIHNNSPVTLLVEKNLHTISIVRISRMLKTITVLLIFPQNLSGNLVGEIAQKELYHILDSQIYM